MIHCLMAFLDPSISGAITDSQDSNANTWGVVEQSVAEHLEHSSRITEYNIKSFPKGTIKYAKSSSNSLSHDVQQDNLAVH